MTVAVWHSNSQPDPGLERAWESLLGRLPFGQYAIRLDYLRWSATPKTPTLGLLVEEPNLTGVIAARWEAGRWVSGYAWRWQAAAASRRPT